MKKNNKSRGNGSPTKAKKNESRGSGSPTKGKKNKSRGSGSTLHHTGHCPGRESAGLTFHSSMADDHRGSRPSITSIVRAVVENLDHPPPQVPPMKSNDASASVRSVNGINTELNRAFQIPRGRVTAASSGTTFATRLASGFNPQWNYTNTQQHRVNRRGRSRSACGRFQPYSRGTSRSSTSSGESVYYNDVCLLPSPSWESVPRGSTKLHLIQKGMFIDAWPISKTWEEADLKRGVAKLFERFLGQPPIAIG